MKIKKIDEKEIEYIAYLGRMLPIILKDFNEEIEKKDEYVYSSESRARFDRLRIEMNKSLMKIRKKIYG